MAPISKRLEKAEKYVQKGKIADALEEYLLAFREDPSNDGLVEIIAELYVRLNQPAKAIECYAYLFDKRVEHDDGRAALLMFRKMGRLGPLDPERLLICARFQEKQKPAEARDSYQLCAQMFEQRGDKLKALDALRGLAALDDADVQVQVRLAEMAESLGQKEPAAQALLRAGELLRVVPNANSIGRAVALLERARQLAPDSENVAMALAAALLDSGKPEQAVELLEPFSGRPLPERNRLLAAACLAGGKIGRAEEVLWRVAPTFPDAYADLLSVLEAYLAAGDVPAALNLFPRLRTTMTSAKKEQRLNDWVEGFRQNKALNIPQLEFLVFAYRELNRDSASAEVNARLFDACVEAGEYPKAANALQRLLDLGSADRENQERLARLAGKLSDETYRSLEWRIPPQDSAAPPAELRAAPPETISAAGELEDMILQAEMLLQFGSKEQATEYLQDVARLFPGEENRNEKLRGLFVETGLAAPAARPAVAQPPSAAAEPPAADMQRVSEIMRNIQRQTTARAVLSVAVNEIGKTWGASRCLAALCTPGKLPSAAIEYCAPSARQSDGPSVAKLVTNLLQLTGDGSPLAIEDAASAAELSRTAPVVQALGIKSLLILPLMDGDQPIGLVLLQQCDRTRRWPPSELVVLKSIADRVLMTTTQIKLYSLVKAVSDGRSGLLNRGAYLDCLVGECARAKEQRAPLSVALLQFGNGDDTLRTLGEEKIEHFLQEAAQALMGHLRENDIGVRYDSTTLAVVFAGRKGADMLQAVEKIRKFLSVITIEGRTTLPLTAGIAEAIVQGNIDPVDSVTELINRLEAALEVARSQLGSSKLLTPSAPSTATV